MDCGLVAGREKAALSPSRVSRSAVSHPAVYLIGYWSVCLGLKLTERETNESYSEIKNDFSYAISHS